MTTSIVRTVSAELSREWDVDSYQQAELLSSLTTCISWKEDNLIGDDSDFSIEGSRVNAYGSTVECCADRFARAHLVHTVVTGRLQSVFETRWRMTHVPQHIIHRHCGAVQSLVSSRQRATRQQVEPQCMRELNQLHLLSQAILQRKRCQNDTSLVPAQSETEASAEIICSPLPSPTPPNLAWPLTPDSSA